MASLDEPKEVYVVFTEHQWPLHVYEFRGHALERFKKLNSSKPGRAHVVKATLTPLNFMVLVRTEEYLEDGDTIVWDEDE